MRATQRSPDHGEIDGGGIATVRTRALNALNDVAQAARDVFYDDVASDKQHMEMLRQAIDRLKTELGED